MVSVIVALPFRLAIIAPLELSETTFLFELLKFTLPTPPMILSLTFFPFFTLSEVALSLGFFTVTVIFAVRNFPFAVITALPFFFAVITPFFVTDATDFLLD